MPHKPTRRRQPYEIMADSLLDIHSRTFTLQKHETEMRDFPYAHRLGCGYCRALMGKKDDDPRLDFDPHEKLMGELVGEIDGAVLLLPELDPWADDIAVVFETTYTAWASDLKDKLHVFKSDIRRHAGGAFRDPKLDAFLERLHELQRILRNLHTKRLLIEEDATTWPERPFDRDCIDRVPKDEIAIAAVRRCIPNWDGENWESVSAFLRSYQYVPENVLTGLTVFGIRQACIHLAASGRVKTAADTACSSIVPLNPPAAPADGAGGKTNHKSDGRGKPPLAREEAARRRKILQAFNKAKAKGVWRQKFCKTWTEDNPKEPLEVSDLERYQNWARIRKRRRTGGR